MKVASALFFAFFLTHSFWGQAAQPGQATPAAAEDISGMYSFLQEGEFVQVTVEEAGRVTGFISRYGDSESDRGAFLNQFFKTAKIQGAKLSFTTETVHAVWYEFTGAVEHAAGRNPGEEGYRLLRGTLTESHSDAGEKVASKARQVVFKSFPQDLETAPPKKD